MTRAEDYARLNVHQDAELRKLMYQFVVTYWGGCYTRAAAAFDELDKMFQEDSS